MHRLTAIARRKSVYIGARASSSVSRCAFSTIIKDVPYETSIHHRKTEDQKRILPEDADVVVIGGGSLGCSTLYHLSKMKGVKAVLIEKDRLTAGTTWHTAGLLWRLSSNHVSMELTSHTAHLMTTILPEETGLDTGWIQTGGMFIASNKERLNDYQRMSTLGKVYGIESHVLDPKESKEVHPLLNINDLYGTLYSPLDGTMDPAGTCESYTRAATKYGAQVLENCEINDIITMEDDFGVRRISGVETNLGHIKTKHVVNCTGVWAPYIGAMVNVYVPQVAYRHAYVVTEHIDGIINCPNVRDHDGSVYLKRQGDTLQVGGYEPNPIFLDKVDKNFAFGLYDLDWDVFEQHVVAGCHRVPVIEHTGIRSTVCGPESFTPDGAPLLGEDPELRGFYHGSAFNSGGMMYGGGCGKQLAHWIVDGKPELDMFGMDIRRFPRTLNDKKTWLQEKSHEEYAKHYSIAFPHDQSLGGRNQRKDAIFEELEKQGAYYEERHGWERPAYFVPNNSGNISVKQYDFYGSYENKLHENYGYRDQLDKDYTFDFPHQVHELIGSECLTCRTSAAIFDISYFGKLFLSGPDVNLLAHRLFSRDVTSPKKHGKCIYTLMLNNDGGVESDFIVASMKDENNDPMYYLSVGGVTTEYCKAHVNKVIQDEKLNCSLTDLTNQMGIISLQGPLSRDILSSVCDDSEKLRKLKFSSWLKTTVKGHPVTFMRLSFVGELGYELHCDNKHMVKTLNVLDEASQGHDVCKAGFRAMDSLSNEIGFHHWPQTIRPDDNPFEAGLAHLCDFDVHDHNFIGKDKLLEIKNNPLQKKLAIFTVNDPIPLFGHEAIFRNNKPVGYVRSAAYCFALKKSIAYGYITLKEDHDERYIPSGEYVIERMGVKHSATFHEENPFDPKFNRIRGKYLQENQEVLKAELSAIKTKLKEY